MQHAGVAQTGSLRQNLQLHTKQPTCTADELSTPRRSPGPPAHLPFSTFQTTRAEQRRHTSFSNVRLHQRAKGPHWRLRASISRACSVTEN